MEIFNVNRQAYQHLGRLPWGSKPTANTVPVGTRFVASDINETEWRADGVDWRPLGGYQIVYNPQFAEINVQYSTLQAVSGIPGFLMPHDMAVTPGLDIIGFFSAYVWSGASAGQSRLFLIGNDVKNAFVAYHSYASSSPAAVQGTGVAWKSAVGYFISPGINGTLSQNGNTSGNDIAATLVNHSPIRLYHRSGDPGGGELIKIHRFMLAVRG
jgi:hypothetical protein